MSKVIMGHNLTLRIQDTGNPLVCATQCQLEYNVDFLETAPTDNGTAREYLPVSTSYTISADGYLPIEASPCDRKVLRCTGLPTLATWTMQVVQSYSSEHGASVRVISGQAYLSSQSIAAAIRTPAASHIMLQGTGAINEDASVNIEDITYQTWTKRVFWPMDEGEETTVETTLTGSSTGYGGTLPYPDIVGVTPRPTPGIRISMSYVTASARQSAPFLASGAGTPAIALDQIILIANGQSTSIPFTVADDGRYIDFDATTTGEYWFFFTAGIYKFIDHISYL